MENNVKEVKPRYVLRQLNYYEQQSSFETFEGESETVPNQSMTVQEVLKRFQAGTLPNVSKTPYYEGSDDFDAVNPTERPDFDLADATQILEKAELTRALDEQAKRDAKTPTTEDEPVRTNEEKE